MVEIDLKPFCSTEPHRPYLHEPWSRDEYSWATNGHIMVRVPRRADVPENAEAPDATRVHKGLPDSGWREPKAIKLPKLESSECIVCDGRGFEHDCPDCQCDCRKCDATGKISSDQGQYACISGTHFALKYVRMLCALPGLKLQTSVHLTDPMPFRFEGGDGVLMPVRWRDGEKPSDIEL